MATEVRWDDDAEASTLGGYIVQPNVRHEIEAAVRPLDFFKPEHREVAECLHDMKARGIEVDPITLASELDRRGKLDTPSKVLVVGLVGAAGVPSEAPRHALIVADLSRNRRVVDIGHRLQLAASNGADSSVLATLRSELEELTTEVTDQPSIARPLDLRELLASDPEPVRYIYEPYLIRQARHWAFGGAESAKSMWAAWIASSLSRVGGRVVYLSDENPLAEDVRRFRRLRPDPDNIAFLNGSGIDLAQPEHVRQLIELADGADLVVIDTLSALWSGDENNNSEIADFDRDALMPLVRDTGASVLVLDHTGHPQAFVKRGGVNAGRGASAKGQKADVVLVFSAKKDNEFTLSVGKMRGAKKPPDALLRVIDTEDGGLDIVTVGIEEAANDKIVTLADAMVEAIRKAGTLTTNQLRAAVAGLGGKDAQTQAMKLLESEDPPRVLTEQDVVETGKGRQRAKTWRVAEETLL